MRSVAAALQDALDKQPGGWAWPRAPRSRMGRTLTPLAAECVRFEEAAEAQLQEATPSTADPLLADYERVLGPDPCLTPLAGTLANRRRAAHTRWTARMGAARRDYIALAATLGIAATIREFRPARAGGLAAGGRLYGPAWQFAWQVRVQALPDGPAGIAAGEALACLLRRTAPAHTVVLLQFPAEAEFTREFSSEFQGGSA